MKCHYEVLNVERDADEPAIKKSYRKLALKWHPDKNLDNLEEATREFRIVQQAYDVLCDAQERAWYDKHREAILRGGMGHGGDYEDDAVDVYPYFNSSCYTGFHDGDEGFYTVYRELFERIADEDYSFVDNCEDFELPGFGDSQSDYTEVVGVFYGRWESYNTKKSYVWEEKWDTRTAPDRYTRRAMEKENKKVFEAKKKERNSEVRALVAFVKKRDKRVVENRIRLQERAKELERLTKEKQLQDGRQRLELMANYVETEWSATSHTEAGLQSLENTLAQEFKDGFDSSASEGDESMDPLYCAACNKSFKTDRSFSNHQRSRKHRDIVAILRQELLEQDQLALFEELNLGVEEEGSKELEPEPLIRSNKKSKKKKRKEQMFAATVPSSSDSEFDVDADLKENTEELESTEAEPSEPLTRRLADSQVNERTDEVAAEDLPVINSTGNASEVVTEGNASEVVTGGYRWLQVVTEDTVKDNIDDFVHKSANKMKNKNKKSKKQTVTSGPPPPKETSDPLQCKVCLEKLSTRNKLFDHIKTTGHAALKLDTVPSGSQSNSKSKKKTRRRIDD